MAKQNQDNLKKNWFNRKPSWVVISDEQTRNLIILPIISSLNTEASSDDSARVTFDLVGSFDVINGIVVVLDEVGSVLGGPVGFPFR